MDTAKGKLTVIRLATAVGMILSMVSLVHFLNLTFGLNQGASFCNLNETFNCDAVNSSKWSTFLGLPLAAFGGAFYLFIFLLSFIQDNYFRRINLIFFSALASLSSAYLFYVSEFIIGSLCIMCLGMYLMNFLILFTSLSLNAVKGNLKSSLLRYTVAAAFSLMFMLNITRVTGAVILRTNDFYGPWIKQDKQDIKVYEGGGVEKDYSKGPEDAAITIIEFSDMECPACRKFYLTLENLLPDYQSKIKIIYKNFPLDRSCNKLLKRDMHMNACYAAVFARCAGEQDKFWQTVNYIFNLDPAISPENKYYIKNSLETAYSLLGLDKDAMTACLQSGRQAEKIAKDLAQGEELELHATPSVWVNGRKLILFSEEALKNIFNGIIHQQ